MAKQKNFDNLATEFGGRSLSGFFNSTEPFEFTVESSTEVTFVASNEFSMVLKGTGFDSDETSLTAGKITSVTFFNADGQKLSMVTDISIKATSFFDELSETDTTSAFLKLAFKGKDKMTASDLGDMLFAGKGDDVLKGGDGFDFFFAGKGRDKITTGADGDVIMYAAGDGKDVITDFDITGDDRDAIDVEFEMSQSVDVRKSGKHDTLLDFGDGDTILLVGVKAKNFEPSESFI